MIFVLQTLIFLAALAGIAACSLAMIYFAGRAMNRAQAAEFRNRATVLAVLSVVGIVASAALGFVGVGAVMFFASR